MVWIRYWQVVEQNIRAIATKFLNLMKCLLSILSLMLIMHLAVDAQVIPKVSLVGGDDTPALKQRITGSLETLLFEMNRLAKGVGDIALIRKYFTPDAYAIFEKFVVQNHAYTARKHNEPFMISRERGQYYDIRSITVKVALGETEASDNQSLVFTFSKDGMIVSVRSVLPNYDYQSVLSNGVGVQDSLVRCRILDFLERFRMAYNTKDSGFLQKIYSDEALILVGTVLQEKKTGDDFSRYSLLSETKFKLVQQTKREYLDALKKAFKRNSFINVRFDRVEVLQHEKINNLYGITCRQEWNSATYSDRGHLFLMMDFRQPEEPIIHVRAWQPRAFDDGSFVSLYDFDVVQYK